MKKVLHLPISRQHHIRDGEARRLKRMKVDRAPIGPCWFNITVETKEEEKLFADVKFQKIWNASF